MGHYGSSDLLKSRAAVRRRLVIQNVETLEEAIKLLEKRFECVVSCALCLRRLCLVRSTVKLIVVSTHSQQKTKGR